MKLKKLMQPRKLIANNLTNMNWEKFLDLIKKTGDRLIVTDKDEGEAYVVMSLSEYEDLVSKIGQGHGPAAQSEPKVEAISPDALASDPDSADMPLDMGEGHGLEEAELSEEERFYLEPIE